jgi:hypothetical protein
LPQIFPESANKVPLYLVAGLLGLTVAGTAFAWYYFSPEFTDVGYRPEQPVPFSHKLHAGELRLDCRYCHAQVEVSAHATVPPTKVCMNCHRLVGQTLPTLAAIRTSMEKDRPMEWVRVHKIPDYAYFDHSIHIRAGVGCSSCHGDIRSMEVVEQVEPLSMGWCLECHREPDLHLRPRDEITDTTWKPPKDQLEFAARVKEELRIQPREDCSACHR